jgi:YD repeat-containing protein
MKHASFRTKLAGYLIFSVTLTLALTLISTSIQARNWVDTVWVEDALPAGATTGGTEPWTWVSTNPAPFSGTLSHQSTIAAGFHQHYFINATATLAVGTGDVLFAYVYLDPSNTPSEVMLQWNDGAWLQNAYWGADLIPANAGKVYMGALPATGGWIRLEVPASQVGLEGKTLKGMSFKLYGGRATWDKAGKSTPQPNNAPTVSLTSPTNQAVLPAPANITINATAADNDGGVSKVEFFQGSTKLGEDMTSPYSFTWNNVSVGGYSITARATDSDGATATSSSVNITISTGITGKLTKAGTTTPIAGATIQVYQGSTLVNTGTTNSTGDYSVLGLAVGDYTIEASASGYVKQARYGVTVNETAATTANFSLKAWVDTVWIEDALPTGAVAAGDESWTWISSNPPPFSGTSAHQSSIATASRYHGFSGATSTLTVNTGDVLFAYVYLDPVNTPSEVMLQWNDGAWLQNAYWGADLIAASLGKVRIGDLPATGGWARLEVPASQLGFEGKVMKGMRFKVYGGRVTWDRAGKAGLPANSAPTINITSPANQAMFSPPANITINAAAADSDGNISKVEFFEGTTELCETTISPYSCVWNNASVGSYSITARATDNEGAVVTSNPINISVLLRQAQLLDDNFNSGSTLNSKWALVNWGDLNESDVNTTHAGQLHTKSVYNSATARFKAIMQPLPVGDFTVETRMKMTSSVDAPYYDGGLLLSNTIQSGTGDQQGFELSRTWYGNGWGMSSYRFNQYKNYVSTSIQTNAPSAVTGWMKIKLRRDGDLYYFSYSVDDGVTWTSEYPTSLSFTPAYVGLFISNGLGSGQFVETDFDYFRSAPVINITSPVTGSILTAPTNITISATPSEDSGTISKVEFFEGTTKLGETLSPPWNWTWNNVQAGTYSFTARATTTANETLTSSAVKVWVQGLMGYWKLDDGAGLTANDSSGRANQGTVSAYPSWTQGKLLGALSLDGIDDQVNFSPLTNLTVGEATFAWWFNVPANGARDWTDWWSLNATGGTIVAEIKPDGNPALYSLNNIAGATSIGEVAGHNLRGAGWHHLAVTMSKTNNALKMYLDGVQVGSSTWSANATATGFTIGMRPLDYGDHHIASAIDDVRLYNRELSQQEIAELFIWQPTVSITSPAPNVSFAPGSNITINATATASQGSITKVEFFQGATKLGETTTSPYSFIWNNVPAGIYSITARATASTGETMTSIPISLSALPVQAQSLNENFDDNTRDAVKWSYGAMAPQIYDGPVVQDLTIPVLEQNQRLEITPRANVTGGHWNGYLSASTWDLSNARASVEVPQVTNLSAWGANTLFSIYIDDKNWYMINSDGAGHLIFDRAVANVRDNTQITYNPVNHRFWAIRHDLANDTIVYETSPDGATWTAQRSVARQLSLIAMRIEIGAGTWQSVAVPGTAIFDNFRLALNAMPVTSLTSPANNATFGAGTSIVLNADASDGDGAVSKVEFLQGTTKLGEDATAPYSFTWTGPVAGSYVLTARAIDDLGGVSTSNPVNITVSTLLSGRVTKSDGATAIGGATIKVLQGTVQVGTVLTNGAGDYSILGLAPGTYTVEALAAGYLAKIRNGIAITQAASPVVNFSLGSSSATGITYHYDDLGRLASVIDPAGDAVTYHYDAVGNLESITRQSATQVSVLKLSPGSGPMGTTVVIDGAGFGSTPGQNTVTFNGVPAVVSSASATQLIAAVPSGATTGIVSVTTPTGSASSSAPFSVTTGSSGAPTITGFTPAIGGFGDPIAITGTGFETNPSTDNRVRFNVSGAGVNAATATSITTSFPWVPGSGHIYVTTPSGTAVSIGDFFVPPATNTLVAPVQTFTAASVGVTGRMAIGETKAVAITTPGKLGMIAFDGAAGQQVRLSLTGITSNTSSRMLVSIYNPDGSFLISPEVVGPTYPYSYTFNTQTLLATGTYTIFINPYDDNDDHVSAPSMTLHLDLIQ